MKTLTKQLILFLPILCIVRLSSATSLIDFRDVEFQDGKPTPASILEDSVKLPSQDSLAVLEETADTLQRYPEVKIRLIGFTDDQECVGNALCHELSLRRATLVYEWLLTHGVLSTQVASVEGRGDDPIDFNDYENGRQHNRRVEIKNTQFESP